MHDLDVSAAHPVLYAIDAATMTPPLAHAGPVRHPPQSGWLDELGRLKGGWAVGLGVARCARRPSVQNWPTVPSAASCSRMYWRTCSSLLPGQRVKDRAQLATGLSEDGLPPPL